MLKGILHWFIPVLAFAELKTIQVLTPATVGQKTVIHKVSYEVQYPLLSGSVLRAHPFPGLRQLIVKGKVSKNLYRSNQGSLFELLMFPISKIETQKVMQQIQFGGDKGAEGEVVPLTETTKEELAIYFSSNFDDEASPEKIPKALFLIQRPSVPGFDKTKACAVLRAKSQGQFEQVIKSQCK